MGDGRRESDQNTQFERFARAARELGCDDDEAAFDEKLRRIAGHKLGEAAPKPSRKPGEGEV
jgi:hypothetical protein